MINTRPYLCYVISFLSRFMSNYGKEYWCSLKWVISYVCRTLDVVPSFGKRMPICELYGYVDANFASDRD